MESSVKRAIILQKIEKFIKIPDNIKTIEEIQDLDLTFIKAINESDGDKLKHVLGVLKIRDLANKFVSKEDLIVLKALGIKSNQLSSWILISKMITEARIDEFLGMQKISIIGLENAGKTALLNILQGNANLEIINNLNPTMGVNRVMLTKFDITYSIFDMGGQRIYRMDYIKNAQRYFIDVSMIVYVIDVQDPSNFEKSLNYLKDVLDVLKILNEAPEFLVILHKVDPDIKNNKEIKERIEFLKNEIDSIFQKESFSCEIISYSIYNWFGESKSLYKEIRDYLIITPKKERETIKFLSDSIDKILNMIVNLSASVEQRLLNVEESINDLREWVKYTGTIESSEFKRKEVKTPDLMKDGKPLISKTCEEIKSLLKIKLEDKEES